MQLPVLVSWQPPRSRFAIARAAVKEKTDAGKAGSRTRAAMSPGREGAERSSPPPVPAIPQAQVLIYRFALLGVSLGWGLAYNLSFLASSGLQVDDGSIQAMALAAADASAGLAASVVPVGSAFLAGVLLRLLGVSTIAAAIVNAGQGGLPAVAGPACMVMLCAREIFWFGVGYKLDALLAAAIFSVVLVFRVSAAQGSALPLEAMSAFEPLSAWGALSGGVLAFGKFFTPLGDDLEEEGQLWSKVSSRPLGGDEDAELVYVDDTRESGELPYVLGFVAAIMLSVLYVFYGLPQL